MTSLPPPVVDPVELMLASIGIRAIVSRAVEKLHGYQITEMAKMPFQIQRLAKEVVSGQEPEIRYEHQNYRSTLRELAQGWDVQQVMDMVKQFPADLQVTGSALVIKSQQLIKEMDKDYPSSSYKTVAGTQHLAPSDTRMFRFLTVLEVIDRPLMVFDLMSNAALLQSQVKAVRTVYPTMSAAIDAALFDAVTAARAAKKSYQLPVKAERGVRAWMGQGPVSPELLARAQQTAKQETEKQAKQDIARADTAKEQLTQAQRDQGV